MNTSREDFEPPPQAKRRREQPIPTEPHSNTNSKTIKPKLKSLTAYQPRRSIEDDNAFAGPSNRKIPAEKMKSIAPIAPLGSVSTFSTPSKSTTIIKTAPKSSLRALPKFDKPLPVNKPPTSPRKKPLASPPRPTSFQRSTTPLLAVKPLVSVISAATNRFLDSVYSNGKPEKKKMGTKSIIDIIPPVPEMISNDGELEGDIWSPTKKKKGYNIGSLAASANAALTSAKTAHTLWIHDLARSLANSLPTSSTHDLSKQLQPSIRLQVLEILPFSLTTFTGIQPIGWGEGKVLVSLCGIVNEFEEMDPAQVGLVIFSLHNHPTPNSNTISISIPGRKKEGKTIFVPSNSNDLKSIQVGSEVWTWGDCFQVVLNPREKSKVKKEELEQKSEDVFWDDGNGGLGQGTQGEEPEEEERALVCLRFGLVI